MIISFIDNKELILSSYPESLTYFQKLEIVSSDKSNGGDRSSNIGSYNSIGTFLIKFIEKDFTKIEGYVDFVYEYKLPFLSAYLPDKYSKYLNDLKSFIKLAKQEIFIESIKYSYLKYSKYFIELQKAFKEALFFCLDIDSPNHNEFKEYSPTQRFFLYETLRESYSINNLLTENLRVKRIPLPININFHKEFAKNNNLDSEKKIRFLCKTDFELSYTYESDDVGAILFSVLIEMIHKSILVKICKYCGKYFTLEGRIDTQYCNNCKITGAKKIYNSKVKNNEFLKLYQREYQRLYSKIRNILPPLKEMKKEKIKKWSLAVTAKIKEGKLNFQEFETWIKAESKKLEENLIKK